MRRAAVSIASNIAEGTSRKTNKDQSHFSTVAYSSTVELLNDLIISNDLKFLSDNHIKAVQFGKQTVRIVTHLDFNNDMLDEVVRVLKRV